MNSHPAEPSRSLVTQDPTLPETDTTNDLPRFSPGLERLLLNSDESAGASRLIAVNPTLRAEAERVLPAVTAALAPNDSDDLAVILAKARPSYGIGAMSDAEWRERVLPYLRALDGLPLGCIRRAFVMWDRCELYPDEPKRQAFYPQPAELFTLATRARNSLGQAQHRIRKALAHVERHEGPKHTPEEIAARLADDIASGVRNPDGSLNMANLFKPRTMGDAR